MKKSRFSEEQMIAVLKERQAGIAVADLCRKHGISDATLYNWRNRYGGMEASDARRLKALGAIECTKARMIVRNHASTCAQVIHSPCPLHSHTRMALLSQNRLGESAQRGSVEILPEIGMMPGTGETMTN